MPNPHHVNSNSEGVAIDGYDPVAYFVQDRAVTGSPEHQHEWAGATWHFASPENRELFATSPAKYTPQFGGQCAFGASLGKDADASPEAWRIIDGKLCLMKSGGVRTLSKLFTGRIRTAMAG